MDLGIFLLRLVVGLLFVGHGTQKLFGWFGGPGLHGAEGMMQKLGYRPPRVHAILAGGTEVLAGLLFAIGLLTPLAAAMVIGLMINAIATVHGRNGLWITKGGYEYNLVLIVAAFAVATSASGVGFGFLALVVGAAAAGIALHVGRPGERGEEADIEVEAEAREHRRAA